MASVSALKPANMLVLQAVHPSVRPTVRPLGSYSSSSLAAAHQNGRSSSRFPLVGRERVKLSDLFLM
jgi:hypothetical protein